MNETFPVLLRWYHASQKHSWSFVAVVGDAVDPRNPSGRRWDVFRYTQYFYPEVWRVDRIEQVDESVFEVEAFPWMVFRDGTTECLREDWIRRRLYFNAWCPALKGRTRKSKFSHGE